MTNQQYGKLTAGLIAAWFAVAFAASALHVIETDSSRPPLPLGIAAVTPIILFLLWFRGSERFRQFVLALNPRTLTFLQAWRIDGFVFLALYTYGILPGLLALPAGWGDVAIGATAPLVALRLVSPDRANSGHRKSFILWQALGITDLVSALSLGATASLIDPHGIATSPMTALPLSLIPTFEVPLLFILHIICIAQALRWREERSVVGAQSPFPAV
jgi:hypothetical protein